jgi:hypothetical protein
MAQQLVDPIIKLYFDLIAKNTNAFKAFYYGDPIRIPASSLPAICCSRRMTGAKPEDSANDQHDMQLVFTVITDIRSDFSDDVTKVPGWAQLYDIVEGRDPATLLLKTTSLLNILRHNRDVANNVWTDMATPTRVDYGLVANKRQPGNWSIEAALTTTVSLVQLR